MRRVFPVLITLLAVSLPCFSGPKNPKPSLAQDKKAIEGDWQRRQQVKRKKKTIEITTILSFSGGRIYTESHRRIITPKGKRITPPGGEGSSTDILGSYDLKQNKKNCVLVVRPMAYSWDKDQPSTRGQKTKVVPYVLNGDTLTIRGGGPGLKGKWKKKGK
jgi:hypothetical protein